MNGQKQKTKCSSGFYENNKNEWVWSVEADDIWLQTVTILDSSLKTSMHVQTDGDYWWWDKSIINFRFWHFWHWLQCPKCLDESRNCCSRTCLLRVKILRAPRLSQYTKCVAVIFWLSICMRFTAILGLSSTKNNSQLGWIGRMWEQDHFKRGWLCNFGLHPPPPRYSALLKSPGRLTDPSPGPHVKRISIYKVRGQFGNTSL